ncbi:hypothetical protein DMUE_0967 [Dictyocoela muelleri]|nr:hypothetical protein DMUE_0967 [Dictyocoela muelleri]
MKRKLELLLNEPKIEPPSEEKLNDEIKNRYSKNESTNYFQNRYFLLEDDLLNTALFFSELNECLNTEKIKMTDLIDKNLKNNTLANNNHISNNNLNICNSTLKNNISNSTLNSYNPKKNFYISIDPLKTIDYLLRLKCFKKYISFTESKFLLTIGRDNHVEIEESVFIKIIIMLINGSNPSKKVMVNIFSLNNTNLSLNVLMSLKNKYPSFKLLTDIDFECAKNFLLLGKEFVSEKMLIYFLQKRPKMNFEEFFKIFRRDFLIKNLDLCPFAISYSLVEDKKVLFTTERMITIDDWCYIEKDESIFDELRKVFRRMCTANLSESAGKIENICCLSIKSGLLEILNQMMMFDALVNILFDVVFLTSKNLQKLFYLCLVDYLSKIEKITKNGSLSKDFLKFTKILKKYFDKLKKHEKEKFSNDENKTENSKSDDVLIKRIKKSEKLNIPKLDIPKLDIPEFDEYLNDSLKNKRYEIVILLSDYPNIQNIDKSLIERGIDDVFSLNIPRLMQCMLSDRFRSVYEKYFGDTKYPKNLKFKYFGYYTRMEIQRLVESLNESSIREFLYVFSMNYADNIDWARSLTYLIMEIKFKYPQEWIIRYLNKFLNDPYLHVLAESCINKIQMMIDEIKFDESGYEGEYETEYESG